MRATFPDMAKAALLVIDMQEYFRGIASPIVESLAGLVRATRRAAVPVVYTQHGHDDPAEDGGMLFEWWDEHIIVGSAGWAILPELAPAPGERIVAKKRYSAFHATDLDQHLRDGGVTDLIIGGVMTNLCCETTAREAFVRDYRVFFLSDGTATASRAMQQATLTNLAFGFATVLRCAELADQL